MELSIMNFTESEDTLRCVFSGKLDSLTCSHIEDALQERVTDFLKGVDTANLVFDLADVPYVSSAFLRICLCHFKLVGSQNFRIENLTPDVRHVFNVAVFAEIMNIA